MSDRDHNPEKSVTAIISVLKSSLPDKLDELDAAYSDDLTPLDDVVSWHRAPLRSYPKFPVQVVACGASEVVGDTRKYGIHEHAIFVETIVRVRRRAVLGGDALAAPEVALVLSQRYAEATELVFESNPRLTVSGQAQVSYAKVVRVAYSATRGVPNEQDLEETRCALLLEVLSTPT